MLKMGWTMGRIKFERKFDELVKVVNIF
jgi:hypothetical protein